MHQQLLWRGDSPAIAAIRTNLLTSSNADPLRKSLAHQDAILPPHKSPALERALAAPPLVHWAGLMQKR